MAADSTALYIGKSPDSAALESFFYGIIDEIRLWNRGISELEIQQLYLAESNELGHGVLTGLITNAENGSALAGVKIKAGMFETVSDAAGNYELELPPGYYDLAVSLEEYLVQQLADIAVTAEETTILNIIYELTAINGNELDIPAACRISCYPNPFLRNNTRNGEITFLLKGITCECKSNLNIYNLKGQKVYQLETCLHPGDNEILWNGTDSRQRNCTSGIYLYRFNTEGQEITGKLIIVR
jgi:predicted DNA-binding ribbon-helix-helix protein